MATSPANTLSSVFTSSLPLGYRVKSQGPVKVQQSLFWMPTVYPAEIIVFPTASKSIESMPSGTICQAALLPHNSITNPSDIESPYIGGLVGFFDFGGLDGGPDGGPVGGLLGGPLGGLVGGPDGGLLGGPLGGLVGGPDGGLLGGPLGG